MVRERKNITNLVSCLFDEILSYLDISINWLFVIVATFLRVDHGRGLFYFGPDHRPVPLQQQFVGVLEKKRFLRDKVMNEVCYDTVVDSLKRGYQIMVFVHSRKGTGETAKALTEIAVKRSELDRYFLTIGTDEHGDAHSKFSDRAMKSRNKEVSEHFQNAMG